MHHGQLIGTLNGLLVNQNSDSAHVLCIFLCDPVLLYGSDSKREPFGFRFFLKVHQMQLSFATLIAHS